MAKEEVLIKVKVDDKDAKKSLGSLEKSIDGVAKSTKEDVNEINTSVSSMTESFSSGIDSIGDSFGSLGAPLASAKQGVASLGQGFKALLANPVVLVISGIVAGLTALYKAFTRTEEGANKVNVVFAYLEGLMIPLIKGAEDLAKYLVAAFENPQQALKDFGTLLVDNVITRFEGLLEFIPKMGEAISLAFDLKFSEAAKVATNALGKVFLGAEDVVGSFEELGETIKETTDEALKFAAAAAELERQEQKLVKLNRENEVLLSKQLKDRELLMNIRDNELLSIEKRIAANEQLNILETEQLNRSKEAGLLGISIAEQRIELEGKTTENLDALAEAQIEYNNILADSAGRQNEYIMNRQALQREVIEFAKAEIDFELEKVNITEDSEEKKLQARIDALGKTISLYDKDSIEYKQLTKEKELAELELSTYKKRQLDDEFNYYRKLSIQQQLEDTQRRQSNIQATKTAAITLANDVANAVFAVQAANLQREKRQRLEAVQETQDRELEILNSKIEEGLINEEQASQSRQRIEEKAAKEKEKIERETFKRKKKQDIAMAITNGAMAITRILADVPKFDFGLSTAILTASAAASTAIQVATIKAQKFAKGGVIEGKSHAEGGVPFTVDGVGGFEAEGGEVIINKRSAAMFRNELSMINQAGGGVKFADGGMVGTANPADNTNNLSEQLERLIAVTSQPTRAVVSETEITDSQNRINNIESRSQF